MLDERSARLRTIAIDNVNDSGWKPGIEECTHEIESGKRRILGRFDDAGVARNDCGKDLPGRNRHGKIPRRDHSHYTKRYAYSHGEFVSKFGRNRAAVQATSFAGHVESGIDRLLNIASSLLENLSHFARHVRGIFLFALFKDLRAAVEDLPAPRSGGKPPTFKGFGRRCHGFIHVVFVGSWENADNIFVIGWILVLKCLSGARFDPFASD